MGTRWPNPVAAAPEAATFGPRCWPPAPTAFLPAKAAALPNLIVLPSEFTFRVFIGLLKPGGYVLVAHDGFHHIRLFNWSMCRV